MKVLIYGKNGWIGSQFAQIMEENKVDFVSGTSRIDNTAEVEAEIIKYNPTHIISFIGRTHGKIGDKEYGTIDYLEQQGKLVDNIRDNLFAPITLAHLSKKLKIHYTYLGTGCIFKFDENHPFGEEINGFKENDMPNFFGSSYSVVKGFTDRLMSQYQDNVLNIRIRMPITGEEHPRNFVTKIVNYKKICSIPNSMTVLPELLPCVLDMMKKEMTGTLNLSNPGLISHNEILQMYKELVDSSFKWENFTQEEQRAILDADRSNNFLDTTMLEQLYPNVKNIKESVREQLILYGKNKEKQINLLITGGCGFIGSNFINHYFAQQKVNQLVNLDALYYCGNVENIDAHIRADRKYTFIHGNLCDSDLIADILDKYKITHVIHFAAQTHVQKSFDDSLQFTKDNIMGTHTILEECRKYNKIKKFIHVSTDEVYGESEITESSKTEKSLLNPTNPYAATKAGAEMIASSYRLSYGLPIIITRGNNVYGPNQYPEKLIPLFIKLLKEGKKVTIQGDGSALRAFQHVLDTAKAFELILEKGVIGEIYNIGSDDIHEISVLQVAQKIISIIKQTNDNNVIQDFIEYIPDRPFNDKRYFINNTKLKELGWTQQMDFDTQLINLINA